MAESVCPDVIVYICHNCIPEGGRLPHQWDLDGVCVHMREIPCSGKIDAQYLFHALEGGAYGLCVIACPQGECHLLQGNYRAEVRIRTVQRLLSEIGIECERAELIHFSQQDSLDQLEQTIRAAVERLSALGESPIRAASMEKTGQEAKV